MKRIGTLFAKACTEVLNPFLILGVLIFWTGFHTDRSWLTNSSIISAFICLVPLMISLYMTRTGAVTDKYIKHRQQRHLFYALSLCSMLLGLVLTLFILKASNALCWLSVFFSFDFAGGYGDQCVDQNQYSCSD